MSGKRQPMTKQKRIFTITGVVVLICALIVGVILLIRNFTRKPVEVFPVSNINNGMVDDGGTLSGQVAQGDVQTLKLLEAPLESIKVKEGSKVKVGDVLATFDMTQVKLTKLSHKARLGAVESELRRAKRELARVSNLTPAPEDGGGDGGGGEEPRVKRIDHGELPFVDKLTPKSKSATEGKNVEYYVEATGGASLYDLLYFVKPDTVISSDFLKMLKEQNKTCELRLFTIGDDKKPVRCGSWVLVGSLLPAETADSSSQTEEDTGTGTGTGTEDSSTGADEGSASENTNNESTSGAQKNDAYADWRAGAGIIGKDGKTLEENPKVVRNCGVFVSMPPLVYERFEEVPLEDDNNDDGEAPEEQSYTREQIDNMIREQKKAVETASLDVREARIAVQQDELVNDKGEVQAKIAGTVTKVADPKKIRKGDTLLSVQGKAAYSVTIYVDELSRNSIQIGDTYRINTYQSGASGIAHVKKVGTVPAPSGQYASGNPSNTFYPVTCEVTELDDPSMSFEVGEGCDARKSTDEDESDIISLDKMYIRNDKDGYYVMAANPQGRLERRGIKVGRIYWGSTIEVKDGLTQDDKIAFPYGRDVVEGAPTKEVDSPSMDF